MVIVVWIVVIVILELFVWKWKWIFGHGNAYLGFLHWILYIILTIMTIIISLSLSLSLLWVGGVVDTFGAYLRRFWLGEGLKVFWGNFIRRVIVGMSSFRSKVKGCGFKLQQGLLFIECLRAAFRRLPVQNKYGVLVLMFSAFGCWLLYGLVL